MMSLKYLFLIIVNYNFDIGMKIFGINYFSVLFVSWFLLIVLYNLWYSKYFIFKYKGDLK